LLAFGSLGDLSLLLPPPVLRALKLTVIGSECECSGAHGLGQPSVLLRGKRADLSLYFMSRPLYWLRCATFAGSACLLLLLHITVAVCFFIPHLLLGGGLICHSSSTDGSDPVLDGANVSTKPHIFGTVYCTDWSPLAETLLLLLQ
jgi:hypothetical protein